MRGWMAVAGIAGLVATTWVWTRTTAPTAAQVPVPEAVVAVAPADAGSPDPRAGAVCAAGLDTKRRTYVNATWESDDPSWAMDVVRSALRDLEGEITYAQSYGRDSSANLQARVPANQDMSWISELRVGRLTYENTSSSPMSAELGPACERLAAVDRAEALLIDQLADGGPPDAIAVLLDLQRNEQRNLRAQIASLAEESAWIQVNVSFNPNAMLE